MSLPSGVWVNVPCVGWLITWIWLTLVSLVVSWVGSRVRGVFWLVFKVSLLVTGMGWVSVKSFTSSMVTVLVLAPKPKRLK